MIFLVSSLNPQGGGIFSEIKTLINLHLQAGDKVLIIVSGGLPEKIGLIKESLGNLAIDWYFTEGNTLVERAQNVINYIYRAAPARLYPYISHHDVVSCAAVQKGLAGEIVLHYVYDHGSSLGLHNSSIDKIIFKAARQIHAVAKVVPLNKCLLIPLLLSAKFNSNPYKPLQNLSLTTACAAARSYKIEKNSNCDYCDVIPDLMKISNGKHFHFGPLTDTQLERIKKKLVTLCIDPQKFIHISFADNFSEALNRAGIDLFITPFPIPSAKITLEVLSCGIPVACYLPKKETMLSSIDFCDSNQWIWSTADEIKTIVTTVTREVLLKNSESGRKYFEKNHDLSKNFTKLLNLSSESFTINTLPEFQLEDIVDNDLYNTDEVKILIKNEDPLKSEDIIDNNIHNSGEVKVLLKNEASVPVVRVNFLTRLRSVSKKIIKKIIRI